ncbi:MAG: cytochrome c peroxidase [Planctomycetota bacterium]|nr:cytochrome c peroxidase [Planctomycetota bacterium]
MIRPLLCIAFALGCASGQQAADRPAPPTPSFRYLSAPPKGLPAMPAPTGYVPTEQMFELGRKLFHDGILSGDGTVSCATCHPASTGFAHPAKQPPGIHGNVAQRHAPSLFNRGYAPLQRWDGGSPSLEEFVLEPIGDPNEMGSSVEEMVQRLTENREYRRAFKNAFTRPVDARSVQRALATFVRGIVSGDAPYDRFLRGEVAAMSAQERHGQWIFESKGGCWKCHTPPLFTDERFHNTGVGVVDGVAEAGRAAVTKATEDQGKWKTPTLRSVRLTAPYMHDGSIETLEEVVDFYARGGNPNPQLDRKMKPLDLSDRDRAALVAFLKSL